MKFNFNNIEVKFNDYDLVFKRAKVNEYQTFMNANSPIRRDDIDSEDKVDTNKLTKEQYVFLLNSEVQYLASMLESATYKDGEVVEEKEMFISFLLDDDSDFKEWATGYINGEKKT